MTDAQHDAAAITGRRLGRAVVLGVVIVAGFVFVKLFVDPIEAEEGCDPDLRILEQGYSLLTEDAKQQVHISEVAVLVDLESNDQTTAAAAATGIVRRIRPLFDTGAVAIRLDIYRGENDWDPGIQYCILLRGSPMYALYDNPTNRRNALAATDALERQIYTTLRQATPRPTGGPTNLLAEAESVSGSTETIIWSDFIANDLSCLDAAHPRLVDPDGNLPVADNELATELVRTCGLESASFASPIALMGWDRRVGAFSYFGEFVAASICSVLGTGECVLVASR